MIDDAAKTAWCAGLFEGEGSIAFRKCANGATTRYLTVRMTDGDVIAQLYDWTGCGQMSGPYVRPDNPPHYKPIYTWTCSKWSEIERLLNAWMPYLGSRRAARAQHLLANPAGPVGGPRLDEECKRGHKRTEANLYVDSKGHRHCRECTRLRNGKANRQCVVCGTTDMPLGRRDFCSDEHKRQNRLARLRQRRLERAA